MRVKPFLLIGTLVLVGVATGAGAGAAYYWLQATATPPEPSALEVDTAAAVPLRPSAEPLLEQKLATGSGVSYEGNQRVAITLTEAELNQVIVDGLSQIPEASPILQSAQGLSTTIEGGRVRSGVMINAADLPTEGLPPQAQQALSMMTLLGNQSIYVGVEGSPRVEQGRLVLGDDTRIQVGRINLTVADLSQMTGLDPAQLSETLTVNLPQSGVTIDGLEFANGEAILRGLLP